MYMHFKTTFAALAVLALTACGGSSMSGSAADNMGAAGNPPTADNSSPDNAPKIDDRMVSWENDLAPQYAEHWDGNPYVPTDLANLPTGEVKYDGLGFIVGIDPVTGNQIEVFAHRGQVIANFDNQTAEAVYDNFHQLAGNPATADQAANAPGTRVDGQYIYRNDTGSFEGSVTNVDGVMTTANFEVFGTFFGPNADYIGLDAFDEGAGMRAGQTVDIEATFLGVRD